MDLKDYLTLTIAAAGVVAAVGTMIKGLIEYRQQGVTKRAEIFLQMRARLRQDPSFSRICGLLELDSPELREIPLVERDRFVGFFEELALMKNSRLINDQVALYMFGYFAIRCYKSSNFWGDLNKNQPLWSLFMDFAQQMETAQRKFKYSPQAFRL